VDRANGNEFDLIFTNGDLDLLRVSAISAFETSRGFRLGRISGSS